MPVSGEGVPNHDTSPTQSILNRLAGLEGPINYLCLQKGPAKKSSRPYSFMIPLPTTDTPEMQLTVNTQDRANPFKKAHNIYVEFGTVNFPYDTPKYVGIDPKTDQSIVVYNYNVKTGLDITFGSAPNNETGAPSFYYKDTLEDGELSLVEVIGDLGGTEYKKDGQQLDPIKNEDSEVVTAILWRLNTRMNQLTAALTSQVSPD